MSPRMQALGFVAALLLVPQLTLSVAQAPKSLPLRAKTTSMVTIPSGTYRPFYKIAGQDSVRIQSFSMDATPVTNAEFLTFVRANPTWARSKVPVALAERGYLKQWSSDFHVGSAAELRAPVTNVSWFAAMAYAKWAHKRLPTTNEWEYASLAPITWAKTAEGVRKGRITGTAKREMILQWYSKPNVKQLPPVGSVNKNAYGLKDMFGQVWEWTEDFGSTIIPSDARSDVSSRATCGAGAVGSTDPTDYATFMRFAMRSSLKGNYVTDNLGFRCARSIGSSHPSSRHPNDLATR